MILLIEKEQLHRMVLSTFWLKMGLIYVALYFKQLWTLFRREGLWVCKLARARVSACGGLARWLGRYTHAVLSVLTLRAGMQSGGLGAWDGCLEGFSAQEMRGSPLPRTCFVS